MIRVLAALCATTFLFLGTSCSTTSEPEAPALRPLPEFRELPAASVEYSGK